MFNYEPTRLLKSITNDFAILHKRRTPHWRYPRHFQDWERQLSSKMSLFNFFLASCFCVTIRASESMSGVHLRIAVFNVSPDWWKLFRIFIWLLFHNRNRRFSRLKEIQPILAKSAILEFLAMFSIFYRVPSISRKFKPSDMITFNKKRLLTTNLAGSLT